MVAYCRAPGGCVGHCAGEWGAAEDPEAPELGVLRQPMMEGTATGLQWTDVPNFVHAVLTYNPCQRGWVSERERERYGLVRAKSSGALTK